MVFNRIDERESAFTAAIDELVALTHRWVPLARFAVLDSSIFSESIGTKEEAEIASAGGRQ